MFPDWAGTKRDMLCLGALRSPAALCWLFQAIYPELRVTVERTPQDHSMPAPDARLGAAARRGGALGRAVVPVRALEVRIACRDHLSPLLDAEGARRHWAVVALERLRAHLSSAARRGPPSHRLAPGARRGRSGADPGREEPRAKLSELRAGAREDTAPRGVPRHDAAAVSPAPGRSGRAPAGAGAAGVAADFAVPRADLHRTRPRGLRRSLTVWLAVERVDSTITRESGRERAGT